VLKALDLNIEFGDETNAYDQKKNKNLSVFDRKQSAQQQDLLAIQQRQGRNQRQSSEAAYPGNQGQYQQNIGQTGNNPSL